MSVVNLGNGAPKKKSTTKIKSKGMSMGGAMKSKGMAAGGKMKSKGYRSGGKVSK